MNLPSSNNSTLLHLVVLKQTFKAVAILKFPDSVPLFFALDELALVDFSIVFLQQTESLVLALVVSTFVLVAVGPLEADLTNDLFRRTAVQLATHLLLVPNTCQLLPVDLQHALPAYPVLSELTSEHEASALETPLSAPQV